ncbi:MAG: VCBS repeat-containing protein [Planctomycetes bacterium]|nr:VCBS repeat-containing protein [Planctomycetota bacterium]
MRNAWLTTAVVCLVLGGMLWNCRPTAAAPGDVLATFHNPNPQPDDAFGYSLAVTGDKVIVGDPRSDLGADQAGAVHVFDGHTGAFLGTLQHPNPAYHDFLGFSVAAVGPNILAGAIYRGGGAAYLFDGQTGQVVWGKSGAGNLGYSVAGLQGDAAVVALYGGAAYLLDGMTGSTKTVFPAPGGSWSGYSVAAADGRVLVGDLATAAYLFDAATGDLLKTYTNPNPAATGHFAVSVAFLQMKVLVGTTTDDGRGGLAGAVYVFDRDSGALLRTLTNPAVSGGDCFGLRVAAVGSDILVGAPRDDTRGLDAGAAYLFDGDTGALLASHYSPDPLPGDYFGSSIAALGLDLAIGYGSLTRQEAYLYEGVPEPATLALLLAGGAIALCRKKRGKTLRALCLAFASVGLTASVAFAGPNFGTPQNYAVGAHPQGLGVADFNRDGRLDLAVGNRDDGTVSFLYGQPGGGFGGRWDIAVAPPELASMAVADFNRDGLPDLALAAQMYGYIPVLYGRTDGNFGIRQFPAPSGPHYVTAADLDGDGYPDLAVSNNGSNTLTLFYGKAGGDLESRQVFSPGGAPFDQAIADFNRDGRLDIAAAIAPQNKVAVFYGQSDGSLGAQQDYAAGTHTHSLAIADFDRDGWLDLVTGNYVASSITLLYGSDGGFTRRQDYPAESGEVVSGDFNLDGLVDVAVAGMGTNTVMLLYGQPGGGLGGREDFAVGLNPAWIIAEDLDLNGGLDLIVANEHDNTVSVLYNAMPEPATFGLLAFGAAALIPRLRRRWRFLRRIFPARWYPLARPGRL